MDREDWAAYLFYGFGGGGSEDISAGDGVRAGGFELGLDGVDDGEFAQGEVVGVVTLREVHNGGVQQERRLASVDEAVVEEQAEQLRGGERVRDDSCGHLTLHDVWKRGARRGVEVVVQWPLPVDVVTLGSRDRGGSRRRWGCAGAEKVAPQLAGIAEWAANIRGCTLRKRRQDHQQHRLHFARKSKQLKSARP
jgi:hypothetical protein